MSKQMGEGDHWDLSTFAAGANEYDNFDVHKYLVGVASGLSATDQNVETHFMQQVLQHGEATPEGDESSVGGGGSGGSGRKRDKETSSEVLDEHHNDDNAGGLRAAKGKQEAQRPQRRTRSAEVHNLSERKRRALIRGKLKALQELVPNSHKEDTNSILDDVIEYIKAPQHQAQMLAMVHQLSSVRASMGTETALMRCGFNIPMINPTPFFLPGIVNPHLALPAAAAGLMPSFYGLSSGLGVGVHPLPTLYSPTQQLQPIPQFQRSILCGSPAAAVHPTRVVMPSFLSGGTTHSDDAEITPLHHKHSNPEANQ